MKILRENIVLETTGLSRTSIWRLERQGQFPERLQLGGRSVGWIEHEILKWIETRPRGIEKRVHVDSMGVTI